MWDVTGDGLFVSVWYGFLLTHPVWDVTEAKNMEETMEEISTHTSRVGCDLCHTLHLVVVLNFYSHIPCGM